MNVKKRKKLSKTQYGIFMESILFPERTTYNLPFLLKLKKNVDIEQLKKALDMVIKAHPGLNSSIVSDESGQIYMEYGTEVWVDEIGMTDFQWGQMQKNLVKPFEFPGAKATRFQIIRTESDNYLFMDFHHVLFDGSSMAIFYDNLKDAYHQKIIQQEQYSVYDIVEEEEKNRKTDAYQKSRAFWEQVLEGYDTDSVPVPDTFEDTPRQEWLEKNFKLDMNGLREFRKRAAASTTAFFTTVMGFIVAKYNYTSNSVISTVYSGRNQEKTVNTIGMLVETMPFVTDLSKYITTEELVQHSMEVLSESRENTLFSYMDLVQTFDVKNDINFAYQGSVVYDCKDMSTEDSLEEKIERIYDDKHIEETKLLFEVYQNRDTTYTLHVGYRADLYSRSFAEGMADAFIRTAEAFLKCHLIADISMVGEEATLRLDSFNDTVTEYDKLHTLVEQFRQKAEQYPEHIAVYFEGKELTYRQLNQRTDVLAGNLRKCGIGREKVGAVLIPRNEYMVIASLAILKAGGGYLPMDATYPPERLNMMIEDSHAILLITSRELNDVITEEFHGQRFFIEDIEQDNRSITEAEKRELMACSPKPEDLFIMLYTSGSTGVPKGVMLEHRNLMAFTAWNRKACQINDSSRVTAYASYGFDANMNDLYTPLTTGAAVYIIAEEMRLDLVAVHQYFSTHRITHALMTTQIGRQFAAMGNPGSLQVLTTGGEKLAAMDPPEYGFWNVYGPTECTVLVTFMPIEKRYKDIPIGRAIDNVKLYIVDQMGKRLPVGAAGELWIAGPQVSRGYLNRPEKMKEAFGDNPFSPEMDYTRIYHTGDVVRYLPDGNIQFIGRRDGQVKIRGFRIELTEVEEVIRRYPTIVDAVVVAYDEPSGGKYIAAYVVADQPIEIEKLEKFIMEEKPPYMVPAITMQIDAIPYNQNQKVNKKVLPKPLRREEKIIPPGNEVQQKIYDAVAEIIGHREFGIDSDFARHGLNSIGVVQLNVALADLFNIPIKISDLKTYHTVRMLEVYFQNAGKQEQFDVYPNYALTKTQQGIFTECMAHPDSTIYNIPMAFELSEQIELSRLKGAVTEAINAHAFCLTHLYMNEEGEIRLNRDESVHFEEDMIEEIQDEFENVRDTLIRPYDLLKDMLVRIKLIVGTKNYLLIDMHHIISDGTSMSILIEAISEAYRGEPLLKEVFTGYEVSKLEELRREDADLENAKKYYGMLLADADTECVLPRTVKAVAASTARVTVTARGIVPELKHFCEQQDISLSALFNSAFGYVLCSYLYKNDVQYSTVYNGRSDSRMQGIVSMLVKTFPVRCRYEKEEKVTDYLHKIGNQLVNSMMNDIYSFAELVHDYQVSADILFTYQGDLFTFDALCGAPCTSFSMELDEAKANIDIDVVLDGQDIRFECIYRSNLYHEDFIRTLAEAVSKTAVEFTTREYLKDVSILTEDVKKKLEQFNDTDYPVADESVNCMFERHAQIHPERLAVIAKGESVTYDTLNKMANRVAHALLHLGVGKDEIVGLISGRTKEIMIGELGILKASAAFLPMVPEYPDDRIDYCLSDAGSRFVITTEEIKQKKAKLFADKVYQVLTFEELLKCEETENPDVSIPTDALAYCIYTSGSTGNPKGVMIEHHNLRNFLDANPKNPETNHFVQYGHVVLSVISVAFDFSLMEVQLPLCNGLTVCIADEEQIHDPLALARLIETYQVDVMACTPSFIGNMIDIPEIHTALSGMHLYDFGAEAFPSALYEKLKQASPAALICNGYGPTEATISCISKVLENGEAITIGCPAANVQAYVCDQALHQLPIGACGELVIGGYGVGRGYMNLPDKTSDVFVEMNQKRVYRSGDLVRILDNGEIEFFGRFDNQVKLRGFRVELDEIENNINSFPGVNTSKVIVRNNGSEDYLAAFFTADRQITLTELTTYLKEHLTYYMVPSVMMQLDAMPLTVNGKIDKKKLPSVEYSVQREYVKPENGLESKICEIYGAILKQEQVGATDDFFEIGGTSLTATIVVLKLADQGYKIVYKDIFEYPTPRELGEFLGGEKNKKIFNDNYDYSHINELLSENTLEHIDDFEKISVGNLILTGSTGFLGIHILKAYLENYDGIIYCLVRKGKYKTPEQRLKNMIMYYHGKQLLHYMDERIICIDADITDLEQIQVLKGLDSELVINCAACVKHFVKDDILDQINVQGVKNLIDICLESNKRLLQVSTTSIGGMITKDRIEEKVREDRLYFDQIIDNDYVRTKFLAERALLEAKAEKGLEGAIVRVGNLMSRNADGEFQINFVTNGFMRSLKAYKQLGAFPVTMMHEMAEFSPIDSTAEAILRLACIHGKYSVYHAYNSHLIYMSDVLDAMKAYGFSIDIVSEKHFSEILREASKNDKLSEIVLGLIAYDSGTEEMIYSTAADNRFTAELLYRMGYLWPITDNRYLFNVISVLDGFEFFGMD